MENRGFRRKNFSLTERQFRFFRELSDQGFNTSKILRRILDAYLDQARNNDDEAKEKESKNEKI